MREVVLVILVTLVGCASPTRSLREPAEFSPLERRLAKNPEDARVNLQLGEAAETGGDYMRAEQYYLRAEALGIKVEEILPRIVRVLVAAQRYGEALERCHLRLQKVPTDRATRYIEASLYVALDRPKDAERELSALQRAQPSDPDAYLALGRLYKDSDPARARAMFEKYLALAPAGQEAEAIRYELDESSAGSAGPLGPPGDDR